MFAQSYNPFGVADPFYLVNHVFYTEEQHRKRHLTQRRHVEMRTRGQQARHTPPTLHLSDNEEEEMRRCRFEILKRYDMHQHIESEDENIVTGSHMEQCLGVLGLQSDERSKAAKEWSSDLGCVPREVNVMQVKYNSKDTHSENHDLWSGHSISCWCYEPKRRCPEGVEQDTDVGNDESQESECVKEGCPPHLIAAEDEDEDDSLLFCD